MTSWSVISHVQGENVMTHVLYIDHLKCNYPSYNFSTGVWFERIENEIQEVPKSKWLERGRDPRTRTGRQRTRTGRCVDSWNEV